MKKLNQRSFLNKDKSLPAVSVLACEGRCIDWMLTDCNRGITLDFSLYDDGTGSSLEDMKKRSLHKIEVLQRHLNALRKYVETYTDDRG